MPFMEFSFHSDALKQNVNISVILPSVSGEIGTDSGAFATYKTLYLLHGLSGNHTSWLNQTSIGRYAAQYGIAVVMPEVGRSWYTDTAYGANYYTFIAEELPRICRTYFKGMSDKREDNFIGGLSMGGYGALKTAFKNPDKYAGCISLSGSLDITRKGRPYDLNEWRSIFGFGLESALDLEGSEHDLFAIVDRASREHTEFPEFYIWCGREDSLLAVNRSFCELLDEKSIRYTYEESEGDHSWKWWDMHIKDGLEMMFGEDKSL